MIVLYCEDVYSYHRLKGRIGVGWIVRSSSDVNCPLGVSITEINRKLNLTAQSDRIAS